MRKVIFIVLATLAVLIVVSNPAESASILNRIKRSLERNNETEEKICRSNSDVCGWEVYDPFSRNLEYYITSSCKCSPEETCVRSEDEIQISAYIYVCKKIKKRKNKNRSSTRRPNNTNSIDS